MTLTDFADLSTDDLMLEIERMTIAAKGRADERAARFAASKFTPASTPVSVPVAFPPTRVGAGNHSEQSA